MHKSNFCAHAIDDIRSTIRRNPNGADYEAIRQLPKLISDSVKFRLPAGGYLFEVPYKETIKDFLSKYMHEARLPFPVCALEMECFEQDMRETSVANIGYDRCIIICSEETHGANDYIVIRSMLRMQIPKTGKFAWSLTGHSALIERKSKLISAAPNNETTAAMQLSEKDILEQCIGDVGIVSQFIAAMACSNSRTTDDAPDRELNRRRIQGGKQPFFTYKILELSASGSVSGNGGGAGGCGTKRVHLRRGHIRRLPDRNIWVNSCVVGDKSKGMVHKDYSVTA